jgi:hypothetical protein
VDVGDCLGDALVGTVAPHRTLPLLQLLVGHVPSLWSIVILALTGRGAPWRTSL